MNTNITPKQVLKALAGLNIIAVHRGLHCGIAGIARASQLAFSAAAEAEGKLLARIPAIDLTELLGDHRPEVKIRVERQQDGSLGMRDAIPLLSIVAALQPANILEIGTYMGATTRLMAINAPQATLHTVDLPPDYLSSDIVPSPAIDDLHLIRKRVVGREFLDTEFAARITQHFHDTGVWNFEHVGQPNLCFIDGSHSFKYCLNDTEKCAAVAAPLATFLWHDCDDAHPGVVDALLAWRARGNDVRRITGSCLAFWRKGAASPVLE